MLRNGFHMDIFVREIKKLVNSCVVKRRTLAKEKETLETAKAAEEFMLARSGIDSFDSYSYFEPEVFNKAGITNNVDIMRYNANKSLIPVAYRETLLKFKREYILDNYIEKNDYYRMLMGLPDYEEIMNKSYLTVPENKIGISTTIIVVGEERKRGVHELTLVETNKFEECGLLDELKNKYPEKKYLNFLGTKKIDNYNARRALNFELLYYENTEPDMIMFDFKVFYANSREYFMNVLYNNNIANLYAHYDNFIGLCIMVMAINRLFASVFEKSLTRDFYDIQITRYLLDSYSVPFISEMTNEQIRILTKNLNILLNKKSSNKILVDLCKVFGFDNVNIYKYYLVKDYKKKTKIVDDVTVYEPILETNAVVYSDGTIKSEYDYEEMFDFYFQRVKINAKDIFNELLDATNKVPYEELTSEDIYWIEDENLKNRLYKTPFNFIESKYIGLEIMFKITDLMFEVNHLFRMIFDKNSDFSKINMTLEEISLSSHSVYAFIIFICALFCRRNNLTGEVPYKPAGVATVYGFNFKTDLNDIIEEIYENELLDDSLVNFIGNTYVIDESDVDRLFLNISNLHNAIKNKICESKDLNEYLAYKKLYNTILTVDDMNNLYGCSGIIDETDPEFILTYDKILEAIDSELYDYMENLDIEDENNYNHIMKYVLTGIESLSENNNIKDLYSVVEERTASIVLQKLVKFFKSYTVDLVSANILYYLDDKFLNLIKVIDNFKFSANFEIKDNEVFKNYSDSISKSMNILKTEKVKLRDSLIIET